MGVARIGWTQRHSIGILTAGLTLGVTLGLTLGLSLGVVGASAGASTSTQKTQAKKALVTLADMPKKWTQEKGSVSGQYGLLGGSAVAGCIGDTSKITGLDLPEVDSPYFENKNQTLELQESIAIFGSAQAARVEFADLANPKLAGCMTFYANGPYKTQLAAQAGKGATAGAITVTSLRPGFYGQGTMGYEVDVPLTIRGISTVVKAISVYSIKGSLGQQISLLPYGGTLPTSTIRQLVSVATHHL